MTRHKATKSSNKFYLILTNFLLIVVFISQTTKKPLHFGRRWGFALQRDKYETKAYTQSNDTYTFSTSNGGRTTPIRLENHIHQPQRI